MTFRTAALRPLRAFSLALMLALAACGEAPPSPKPVEAGDETACALDGMLLRDYPGPKAQLQYAESEPEFYCDTVEMFSMLLRPEQARRVVAAYTQDMARADWNEPRGQWIDALRAFYVRGSGMMGSMGPTFAAFSRREDAEAFAQKHGGKVLRFEEVTPEMADLRGGAHHDERM
ncbi:MAG: Copper-binding lipoprotein NosL [Gammaproteobacteria bacterium]|nr:Copper-binding lipoprotein NosL [Gammaproteobacteria bacterium]